MPKTSKGSKGSNGSNGSRGSLIYYHHKLSSELKNGKSVTVEEEIKHGDKGIFFKYYYKDEKNKTKMMGIENAEGKFLFIKVSDEDRKEETIERKELLKELGKYPELKFALKYVESQKGGARKGSKRGSKKGSKGGVRKGSKKSSKKNSKKGSKRGSKKGGARKGSKKGSKKASKKNHK